MAAGTPPDVYWNRVRASQVLIRREALVDVLPLMKRDKLTQDDFWPSAVRAYTYKGGYSACPPRPAPTRSTSTSSTSGRWASPCRRSWRSRAAGTGTPCWTRPAS